MFFRTGCVDYNCDNYIGGAQSVGVGVDVIGADDKFDVSHMNVDITEGKVTIDIYSRFLDNIGIYGGTYLDMVQLILHKRYN